MADIYRYKVRLSGWSGGPGVNTFFARFPSTPSNSDILDFATQLRSMYVTVKGFLINGHTAAVDAAVDVLDDATGDVTSVAAIVPPAAAVGDSAGPTGLSRATMIKLRFRTGEYVGGREVRGGNYLGPVSTNAFAADGSIASANLTLIPTAFAGLLDVVGPGRLVVWQRPREATTGENALPARAGSSYFVQSVQGAPLPGVMRSRRD